jgi:regulator of protease activity HflC (stomatin/prohibitin superfamily)
MGGTSETDSNPAKHEYGCGTIEALTGDGVGLDVDCTVSWKLDPNNVENLFRDYPSKNWVDIIIIPAVREVVRTELSKYAALEVVENRSLVVEYVVAAIEETVNNLEGDSDAIIYVESHIRNIKLPDVYVQALEEKATAEQQAIAALFQAQEIITLAEANAQALLIAAQTEANASIIQANASAQAVYIQAQSIAEAVELLANVTGTENATQIAMMYLWIQALQVIANSTGNQTYFITFGSGGVPYIYTINPEGGND